MNRLTLCVVALIAATGCGDFVPTAGSYEMSELTVAVDGCNLDDGSESSDGDDFELSVDAEALTTVADLGESFQFSCVLDGNDMICEDYVLENDGQGYSVDQTFTFGGVFLDEVTLDGSYGITMACEGERCAEIEAEAETTLPCTSTFDFTAATAPQ